MPVFFNKDISILHIHPPKTGGTYIGDLFVANGMTRAFFENRHRALAGAKSSPQHYHAELARSVFQLDHFDVIFTTIRNPFDRLISEYFEQIRLKNITAETGINQWIMEAMKALAADPYAMDNHLRPQCDFLIPGSQLFRQENGFDLQWARRLLGDLTNVARWRDVERSRVSPKLDCELDARSVSAIVNCYREDFRRLAYSSQYKPSR